MRENQINAAARNVMRIVALFVAAAAALALLEGFALIYSTITQKSTLGNWLFGTGMWLFFSSISVWCFYAAYHGWFHKTSTSVRRVCGALAFVVFFIGQGVGDSVAKGHPGYPESTLPAFAISIIAAIIFYLGLIGLLLPRLAFREDRSLTEQKRHVRNLFGYIALMIFLGGDQVSGIAPSPAGHVVPNLWTSYVIVGVLLLAVLIYATGPSLYWRIFSHPLPPALESPLS